MDRNVFKTYTVLCIITVTRMNHMMLDFIHTYSPTPFLYVSLSRLYAKTVFYNLRYVTLTRNFKQRYQRYPTNSVPFRKVFD